MANPHASYFPRWALREEGVIAPDGRVPSYLGSTFSFIPVVIPAPAYAGSGPNANLPLALGGIIAAGALYAAIGLIVMKTGYAWIEWLMPPW